MLRGMNRKLPVFFNLGDFARVNDAEMLI